MNVNDFFNEIPKIQTLIQQNNYVNIINQLNSNLNNFATIVAQQRQRANSAQVTQGKNQIITSTQQALNAYLKIEKGIENLKTQLTFKQLGLDSLNEQSMQEVFKLLLDINNTDANKFKNYLTQYHQKLSQINQLNSIANIFTANFPKKEVLKSDGISIFFREGVSVEYLSELSKASSHWNQIVHCFGRLTSDGDNKAKIETIEKGSIIMTITATTGIILALTKAYNSVLDVVLKTYEVKKKALELKNLKLSNLDKAIEILEKQSELNVKLESDRIAKELLTEFENTDKETQNALFLSIRRLVRFINKGGKLEPKLLSKTIKENSDLNESVSSKNSLLLNIEEEINKLVSREGILKLIDTSLGKDNKEIDNKE
ncbi:hypothetical protein KO566_12955 [Flavobacteriaceae bacterium XHP0103]|uniref:hypothetical protein n=1 Tax=Marixanthotalea marina TaxID=2844359 RepID=UPI002989F36F|nr:hypothetical protein [Marixanthotalea marina]MBU3822973.1 hypothetical protein [Marixanthotalea marina]